MPLARIVTPNPKKGRVVRTYTWKGQKYEAGRGWYNVSPQIAKQLETFLQRDEDPESLKVFAIVKDKAAAEEYDRTEARANAKRRNPDEAVTVRDTTQDASDTDSPDLTTRDLAPPVPEVTTRRRAGPPPRAAAPRPERAERPPRATTAVRE